MAVLSRQGSCGQGVVNNPCSPASWTAPAVLLPSMRAEQKDEPVPLSVLGFAHLIPTRPEQDHKSPLRLVWTRD